MKKKFLPIYALAGALVASPVLTSCVDDNESASVTAVRNAKAEELKSLAALNNAKAEAELIAANADKALKEAQAKFQAGEEDRAAQIFAAEIEKIKAEAEQYMLEAKYEAAKAQQDLNNLANEEIKNLQSEYQTELGELNSLLSSQLYQKTQLAQLEAGLITNEEYAQTTSARYDKQIAQAEFEIALYEKYEAADLTELKQARATAERDRNQLYEPIGELLNAKNDAYSAYQNETYRFDMWNSSDLKVVEAAYLLYNQYNGYDFIEFGTKDLTEDVLDDNHKITTYSLNETRVGFKKAYLESELAQVKETLGTPATGKEEAKGMYIQLAYYDETIANLKKQQEELDKKAANYQEQFDQLQKNIDDYQLDRAEYVEYYINSCIAQVEAAEEALKEFEAAVKSFDEAGEDWKAYKEAIAELTKLAEAENKAIDAYEAANEAFYKKDAEISKLNHLINSAFDPEGEIIRLREDIINYKRIKQNALNSASDSEMQVAQAKEQLATYEAQITAQKAILANIEAAIKAAIG